MASPLVVTEEVGKPSMRGSACKYRSGTYNEPLCCALGFLIDDENHTPSMEDKSPTIVGQMFPTSNPTWQEAFRSEDHFLCDLQDCHDSAAVDHLFENKNFNAEFTRRAKRLAKTYNLKWSY